jgi:pyridoxine 5-phosphate synthase
MTKLSVNVNKLATIRNSRGKNNPDVVAKSLEIIAMGAHGITVHPRPDERHIRRSDVYALKKALSDSGAFNRGIEFNIEGYPSDGFLKMVLEVAPHQCTLVPDPPEALTSNAGWKIAPSRTLLAEVATRLKKKNVRTSVFVDPETMSAADYKTLSEIGVSRVELYTESYAESFYKGVTETQKRDILKSYVDAAAAAVACGLGVNAGHDLNLLNLRQLVTAIPAIDEVSIGHALICDALDLGLRETVKRYLSCLAKA